MGTVIRKTELASVERNGMGTLLIYCSPDQELSDAAISINILLAKMLAQIKPDRRAMRMERCLQEVLRELPENPVLKEFDVMFNPAYEIDILQIFISLRRSRPFRLIWPGMLIDGRLVYAEAGYRDHKIFDINHYDVACVI